MLVPLSWIRDYVEIKMPTKKLADKLTEAGLNIEAINKEKGEIILDVEVTPNRPDWLSMVGIAREMATIGNARIKQPPVKDLPKPQEILPIKHKFTNPELTPRYSAVIIKDVKIRPSPEWIQRRLKMVGLRPINNLVDITNYVMLELGNPLHAFDYDTINPKQIMIVEAKGGEDFKSVDEISYKLPKGALIIKDAPNRIIDLCGIKGGLNTGITSETKTVYLHSPVHPGTPIRRASQALGVQSDASFIYERGVNIGGTLDALKRAANLIIKYAGGKVASDVIDIKQKEYDSWKIKLKISRAHHVLGDKIPKKKIIDILANLNLEPKIINEDVIETTIPTYRNDLQIEEDLIEEVARIYGYNRFSLTMFEGEVPTKKVPYFKDYEFEKRVKNILKAAGFSEIHTYSLVSESDLQSLGINPNEALKISNPVSLEYEYLRPTLIIGLLKAVVVNQANFEEIKLFELGRVYSGKVTRTKETPYLTSASLGDNYYQIKGVVESLLKNIGITNYQFKPSILKSQLQKTTFHHQRTADILVKDKPIGALGEIQSRVSEMFGIKGRVFVFELNFEKLEELATTKRKYVPIPKYPAIVEDLTFVLKPKTQVGDLIQIIKGISSIIQSVELIDSYKNSRTFRITYQNPKKTLTDKEVEKIRKKVIKKAKEKFGVALKG